MSLHNPSKRQFIKTVAYVAPAILTLKVTPSFASTGSGRGPINNDAGSGNDGRGREGNPGNGGGEGRDGNSGSAGSASQGYRKKNRNWW